MLKLDTQRPAYHDFADMLDTDIYEQLPDDWLVGITDVIDSTSAIASGRYKDVNYAGASAIAALGNAWSSFDFPFVFRGDGAAFAVHPDRLTSATNVLQQTAAYARDTLQLGLRTGLVSAKEIRASGSDVKTAQFAASGAAVYAMFAGGGLNWADRQIKEGKFGILPSPARTPPDLTGLGAIPTSASNSRAMVRRVPASCPAATRGACKNMAAASNRAAAPNRARDVLQDRLHCACRAAARHPATIDRIGGMDGPNFRKSLGKLGQQLPVERCLPPIQISRRGQEPCPGVRRDDNVGLTRQT
ncbi:hypothetical protein GGD55_005239 [Rhizobium giardinii]|uniref:Adenylate cyclase n=1 Tax=Rhizobium giardinii TaxID=56731 RepID=A0A7W8UHX2_9HYPH|nr:hypothetical protein [Rhizobium giardinii]